MKASSQTWAVLFVPILSVSMDKTSMETVRQSNDRGQANFGWLDSRHTFSFGEYHDPAFMGFGPLRVINEDRVIPGGGFGEHGHKDMEILSYVLSGALEHKDSIGTGSIIRPGDLQRMSAGTGIRHSEFNASKTEPVHFLQIWIVPEEKGLEPSYEQQSFDFHDWRGALKLAGSRDGRHGSLTIHQDVDLYIGLIGDGQNVKHTLGHDRCAWIQIARGTVNIRGNLMSAGDGVAIETPQTIDIDGKGDAEILVFDMSA